MRKAEQNFCLVVMSLAILVGLYRLATGDFEEARYPTVLWLCMWNQYRVSKIEEEHDNMASEPPDIKFERWDE